MQCWVWQERHQHEQAGGHLTGGKIPRLWHEDPAPHQGLRLCLWKGNWPGWGQPDGRLAPMYGKNVKRLLLLVLLLQLHGSRGKGGTRRFDRFHSWKCLGLCLFNILCGFVTLAKKEHGPVRRERCSFLWENAQRNTIKSTLGHKPAQQVFARSERS